MPDYRIKGASGPLANQSFALANELLLGRADECDVQLDGDDVAPRHCRITVGPDGITVERLDGVVSINGTEQQKAPVSGGDEIRIGRHRFVVQAPGLRPERVLSDAAVRPRPARTWWLVPLALVLAGALAWQRGWLGALLS